MSEYKYTRVDFDNPSFLFVLEDILKNFLGCLLLYNPYIKSFELRGDEHILDFGCGGGTDSKCILDFLNENGYLTCIDTSGYWVKKAEKRLSKYSNVECKLGDIREPIRKSHSIAINEIQTLLSVAGLREAEYEETKSEYRGKFIWNEQI